MLFRSIVLSSSDSDSCHSVQLADKANNHSHEQSSANKIVGDNILSLDTSETLVTSDDEKHPKQNDAISVVHKHDHDLAIFSEKIVQFLKRNNILSCKELLESNLQDLADALSRDEIFVTSMKAVNEFMPENPSCFAISCVKKWKEKVQRNIKDMKSSDDTSINHDRGMRYIEEFLAPSHTRFLKDYFGISTALALVNTEAELIAKKLSDILGSTKSFVGNYKDQKEAFCNGMVVSWFDTVTENLKNGNHASCNVEEESNSLTSSQHHPKASSLSPDVPPSYPYGSPYSQAPNSRMTSPNRLYNEHLNDHPSPHWHRYHGPADRYTYPSYHRYYSAHRHNYSDNQVYSGRYNPSQSNSHHHNYPRYRNHNYMNVDNRHYKSYRSGFSHEKKSPETYPTRKEQYTNHQYSSLGSYDNSNRSFPNVSKCVNKEIDKDFNKKETFQDTKKDHDEKIQNKSNFQMESQNLSREKDKLITKKRKIDSSKSQSTQKTKKQEIDENKVWKHTLREDDVHFLLSQGIHTNKNLAQSNTTLLAFHYDKFRSVKGAQRKGDSRIITIGWVSAAQKSLEKGKIRHLVRDTLKSKAKISGGMSMTYFQNKKVRYNSTNNSSLNRNIKSDRPMSPGCPLSSELQTEEMPLLDNVKHLCKLTTNEKTRLPQKRIISYDCINGE